MIKVLLFITFIQVNDSYTIESPKGTIVEMRRKRGKQNKGRRRGGNGLR